MNEGEDGRWLSEAPDRPLAQGLDGQHLAQGGGGGLVNDHLAVDGRRTEARGEVHHRTNRGVVNPTLVADPPDGRLARGDPDPESDFVAARPPPLKDLLHRAL